MPYDDILMCHPLPESFMKQYYTGMIVVLSNMPYDNILMCHPLSESLIEQYYTDMGVVLCYMPYGISMLNPLSGSLM